MTVEEVERRIEAGAEIDLPFQSILNVAARMARKGLLGKEKLSQARAFELFDAARPYVHLGPIMKILELGLRDSDTGDLEKLKEYYSTLNMSCENCDECFFSDHVEIIEQMDESEFRCYLRYLMDTKWVKACCFTPIFKQAYRFEIVPHDMLMTALLEAVTIGIIGIYSKGEDAASDDVETPSCGSKQLKEQYEPLRIEIDPKGLDPVAMALIRIEKLAEDERTDKNE